MAGCQQWFTGLAGTFQSYNYPTNVLALKDFTQCFRRELGYCAIDFNVYDPTIPNPSPVGFVDGFLDISGLALTDHVSGYRFSDNGGTGVTALVHSTVRSTAGTYVIEHNSRNSGATAGDNKGYKLTYSHVPCGIVKP